MGRETTYRRKGTNLPAMGDYNCSVVLEAIREHDDISRIEISRMTGLTAQTVTNIVRKLIDQGLVYEQGIVTGRRGKPRTSIRLNEAGRFAIGVHIDPARTTIVLIDLCGRIIDRIHPDMPEESSDAVQIIAREIERMIEVNRIPEERLGGVGIAVPGPIDIANEVVLDPPNLPGWRDVPVTQMLNAALHMPVLMEKDATAACHGEAWSNIGVRGGDFLMVYVGLGIAFGVVKDGEVQRGMSGNEGEIGHIVVDLDGPQCWCGQHGCIAVTCDPRSIVNEAERLGLFTKPTGVAPSKEFNDSADLRSVLLHFDELRARACDGEHDCDVLFRRVGHRLGRAVTILTDMFDMERVIGGGPYWQSLERFYVDGISDELRSRAVLRRLHDFSVESSSHGCDVAAIGAASAILDRAFTPRAASLMLT